MFCEFFQDTQVSYIIVKLLLTNLVNPRLKKLFKKFGNCFCAISYKVQNLFHIMFIF